MYESVVSQVSFWELKKCARPMFVRASGKNEIKLLTGYFSECLPNTKLILVLRSDFVKRGKNVKNREMSKFKVFYIFVSKHDIQKRLNLSH